MATKTFTTLSPDLLYLFLADYGKVADRASYRALELKLDDVGKAKINTTLQNEFGLLKRHANSIIAHVEGAVKSAKECRKRHIEQLEGKLKSVEKDIKTREKRIKDYRKAKRSRKFKQSHIKDCCSLRSKSRGTTQVQDALFGLHQKKRSRHRLKQRIEHLKTLPLDIDLGNPRTNFMWVGSGDEPAGNGIAQLSKDGVLRLRVPYCLEEKYGQWIVVGPVLFDYGNDVLSINRNGANTLTLRFYARDLMWRIAATLEVADPIRHSLPRQYGCIAYDLNPDVLGWVYVDADGNLQDKGQFRLTGKWQIHGKRSDQIEAILCDVAQELVRLAIKYNCPVVGEKLDFSEKKEQLGEKSRQYARMLSNFAYRKWDEVIEQACNNNGVEKISVNAAYSSSIGLMKYAAMYGLSSDMAAALVLARRAMKLSERVPSSYAYRFASRGKNRKHVWSHWNVLHKGVVKVRSRHSFYFTTRLNRARKVKPQVRIGLEAIQLELFECGASPQGSVLTARNTNAV